MPKEISRTPKKCRTPLPPCLLKFHFPLLRLSPKRVIRRESITWTSRCCTSHSVMPPTHPHCQGRLFCTPMIPSSAWAAIITSPLPNASPGSTHNTIKLTPQLSRMSNDVLQHGFRNVQHLQGIHKRGLGKKLIPYAKCPNIRATEPPCLHGIVDVANQLQAIAQRAGPWKWLLHSRGWGARSPKANKKGKKRLVCWPLS